ncbi:class I SAM-dependent methyltransferase [Hymenobacter jeollabukensis]|uniref:Class I SAM-dependent methyltransferase n=1 Tax=Hymenobacter jeollabukensis TaxID=2025313 RepID=A0A5R8WXY1_9BACT|nr:methyltransferase domain-containing protein [Hymenobacter jeollabukensis]TLM97005.1 class I SAM-dependent methyltransferase [Hymenobacter jeollabukensis]
MERVRRPWEGTWNIVRFNWHFYAGAGAACASLLLLRAWPNQPLGPWPQLAALGIAAATLVSLLVSAYVYDGSGLYQLAWLREAAPPHPAAVVNIHAGFDESSHLLLQYLRPASLAVLDFYDPAAHTELAIRRARRAYPAFPGTRAVPTGRLPLPADAADLVLLMLAAHEIRSEAERTAFFREAGRITRPGGRIVVVEHLRDAANLLAYNVGAFHFYSRRCWRRVFGRAGLRVLQEQKITPFVAVFTLTHADSAG